MDTFIDIFFREKYFGHSLAKRGLLAIAMVALAYLGMEYFMGGAQGLVVFVAGALGFVGGAFKGVDFNEIQLFEDLRRSSDDADEYIASLDQHCSHNEKS